VLKLLKRALITLSLGSLFVASAGQAATFNITLDADLASSPDQIIFTVGIEDASDGSPLAINGYTLDFTFDEAYLSFASVTQLAQFGGVAPAMSANCATAGRCTAGNVPSLNSSPLNDLFSVTFDVLDLSPGLGFSTGILDSVFNGITQAVGDPIFDEGSTVIVSYTVVPEPSTFALASLGMVAFAAIRRCQR
jgi:hypothetical protein